MKILKVIVDKLPESCLVCGFSNVVRNELACGLRGGLLIDNRNHYLDICDFCPLEVESEEQND